MVRTLKITYLWCQICTKYFLTLIRNSRRVDRDREYVVVDWSRSSNINIAKQMRQILIKHLPRNTRVGRLTIFCPKISNSYNIEKTVVLILHKIQKLKTPISFQSVSASRCNSSKPWCVVTLWINQDELLVISAVCYFGNEFYYFS